MLLIDILIYIVSVVIVFFCNFVRKCCEIAMLFAFT